MTPPEKKPFWSKKTLSFTYGFNDTNSKLGGAETQVNVAKTELYLESKTKFALTTSLAYQNFSKTDNLGNLSDTNVYSFAIQPSQELFHLFDLETSCKGQLVAGFGLGYSRFEGDSSGPAGASSSDADAYSISPNFVYVRPFEETPWTIVVSPTYTMQWKNTAVAGMPDVDTNAGVFSLLGRVDRKLTPECTVSVSATWKDDVNQRVAPGKTAVYRDWAEFGISIRYEINKVLQLKFGYSYEAFRSDYDTHKIAATGIVTF